MPAEEVVQVSGHSIRVGATQGLMTLNIDLASVMQAGAGSRTGCRCAMASMFWPRALGWHGRRSCRGGSEWLQSALSTPIRAIHAEGAEQLW